MVPIFMAFSLISELAATTEPVVSRVPPIQAPATSVADAQQAGDPGHGHHHGHGDDQDERDHVGQLLLVALDGPAGGDGRRDPADRHGRREHGGELVVHLELAGDPEAGVPDHKHDEERLEDAHRAGLQDLREEDARAQEHQPGLDVELGAHRLAQPVGHAEHVADEQPHAQGEDHVLQAQVAEDGVAGDELRQPGQRVHHRETGQERQQPAPEQDGPRGRPGP